MNASEIAKQQKELKRLQEEKEREDQLELAKASYENDLFNASQIINEHLREDIDYCFLTNFHPLNANKLQKAFRNAGLDANIQFDGANYSLRITKILM